MEKLVGFSGSAFQLNENSNTDWDAYLSTEKNREFLMKFVSRAIGNKELANHRNYIKDQRASHWKRYREDFREMRKLGANAWRTSIDWSLVEPVKGKFDREALEEYAEYFDAMRKEGLEPVVTLLHFTYPKWVAKKGWWDSKGTPAAFLKYCKKMVEEFPEVRYWNIMNEPKIHLQHMFLGPQQLIKKNPMGALKTARRYVRMMPEVHNKVYDELKEMDGGKLVGSAVNLNNVRWNGPIEKALKFLTDWDFLDKTKQDVIYLNYYVSLDMVEAPKTDMGFRAKPWGVYYVLKNVSRYRKPVMITEFGVADEHDSIRKSYLVDFFNSLKRAEKHVRVIGALHWSIVDNYEWEFGWYPKFGVLTADREPRESSAVLKGLFDGWKNSSRYINALQE